MEKLNPNLKKLPKGWEEIVASEYSSGASDIEVRARLKMTTKMWDSLYNDAVTTEFKQIVDFGRMLAHAWWLQLARDNLHNPKFNTNLYTGVMKNRYGWSEKTTTTTKDGGALSSDEMDARLKALIKKYNKVQKT